MSGRIPLRSRLIVPSAAALLVAAGCGAMRASSAREVSLAEFAQPAQSRSDASATDTEVIEAAPPRPEGPGSTLTRPGPHDAPPIVAARPGERIVVDSLVGHVNGRPIFADEFLEPLADRLRAAAEATTGRQRAETFKFIIETNLATVVENELILAEAEGGLTPEQQQGLFALIRNWKEELIRKGRTQGDIESALAREMGMTLDEYLDTQKQVMLVRELARKKVAPRVIVSWRDIEREYQKRYDEFNPRARVTLARIRLPTGQIEQIQEVQARLEAGESFAVIAEELGFTRGGEWSTFEMGAGGITDIAVSPEIAKALEGLEAGETTAPIVMGSVTLWLHVVELDRPEHRDLYDPEVQLLLTNEIRSRREEQEWDRYIESLLARGVFDERQEMANRLFLIAMERYGK